MASALLERAKIQAQVLVPLLRAFRSELGTDRANAIAWKALEEWRKQVIQEIPASALGSPSASPAERWRRSIDLSNQVIGDATDNEMLKDDSDALEFNVTGCRFAQFFRQLSEPELGFAMLCSFDTTMAEEIGGSEVKLTRTATIMQGADHCDFRYELKRRGHA